MNKKKKNSIKINVQNQYQKNHHEFMPYQFTDYKKFIIACCEEFSITLQDLAKNTQIQKTYLSKILKHDYQLNEDQFFKIIIFFKIEEKFHNYLILLLRHSRAGSNEYMKKLWKEIIVLQKENLSIKSKLTSKNIDHTSDENHLNLTYYFLNPIIQIIHSSLSIEEYRNDCCKLLAVLSISRHELMLALKILQQLGYIKYSIENNDKVMIELLTNFLHLDRKHPLAKQNHSNWRVMAIKKMHETCPSFLTEGVSDNFSFTATICGSRELFNSFNEDLKSLIANYSSKLKNTDCEMVSQLNIDSFILLSS
ncbi:MAG: hypothetical protein HQK51_09525 [Oligoflexia bacterium]|nr:hypothetical protein [Oligoflexia bacterium]